MHVPSSEPEPAPAPAPDPALGPGDAVFETVKVVGGRPFALDLHLERLADGAAAAGIGAVDDDAVRREVVTALAGDQPPLGRLRITVSSGPTVTVVAGPLAPPAPTAAVATVPWPRNERGALVGLKSTAYAENVVAVAHARGRGADEAVLADVAGHLCEGTSSNVFYVVDGELRTPTLASGCLPGVTRRLLLDWFGGTEVDEPIAVAAAADEVLLVSTTRDVQGVHRWDDRELPAPGPVTRRAMAVWREREPELLAVPTM